MKIEDLEEAIFEAERFVKKAKEAQRRYEYEQWKLGYREKARDILRELRKELSGDSEEPPGGKIMRGLSDKEFRNFQDYVKCNWLFCSGGVGLAGRGVCSSNGNWDDPDCRFFIIRGE